MPYTVIGIDNKGIFCCEVPEKQCPDTCTSNSYCIDSCIKDIEAIKQAKRDRVYFKYQIQTAKLMIGFKGMMEIEFDKQYPIPDGYDVKIDKNCPNVCDCRDEDTGIIKCVNQYVILVPKEEHKKQIMAEKFWANIEKSYPNHPEQQSIEEAAIKYADDCNATKMNLEWQAAYRGYHAGAKSQAAKEYWCNQLIALAKKDGNLITIWDIERFKQEKS